jgi:protein CpxP
MKSIRHCAAGALFATLFATWIAATGAVQAAETLALPAAAQGDAGRGPDDGPHHGFGGHGPGAPGPEMPGGPFGAHFGGPFGGMPPLHGLKLSEAQQDKLFAIMHAQAPQRREHDKAIRKAAAQLRDLARADRFDDARAGAAARDLGQAITAESLLQARTEAQVLAVLTPEQRTQLRERHRHGPMGPHDGAHDSAHDGAEDSRERPQGAPDRQ